MKKILVILVLSLVFIGVFSIIQYNMYDKDVLESNNQIIDEDEPQTTNSNVDLEKVTTNSNTEFSMNFENEIINNKTESNIDFEREYNEAINNLDSTYFLINADNYFPESNQIIISEERAKEIAEFGFKESAKRIAGEGVENKESERVIIEEKLPNNYFTRHYYEADRVFKTSLRNCFVVTRENEMGCGVSIYVDANTGLIIGGEAFGD